MSKKLIKVEKNTQLAQQLAKAKDGCCLSKKLSTRNEKAKWKCAKGHTWKTSIQNIKGNRSKKGTWCPYCVGVKNQTSWIDRAIKAAKEKNGKCLSKVCNNQKEKLNFECKFGHRWEARVSHVTRGSWCPKCAGTEKHSIERYIQIAKERGGECLTKKYKNQDSKLKFKCSNGHTWLTSGSSILHSETWCPHCSRNILLKISDLQKLAKQRHGKCLSLSYQKANDKYKWQCFDGHMWTASYAQIYSGSWCPTCREYLGEKFVRIYFENIFKMKFNKVHPEWLRDKVGDPWELDGFGEKTFNGFKIAFEHHGIQHYKYSKFFHRSESDFKVQQSKDALRRIKCTQHKVALFEIPQLFKLTKFEDLPKIIEMQYREFGLKGAEPNFHKEIDYSEAYKNSQSLVLKELIKENKGKLLGQIIKKNRIYLKIECKNKHTWDVVSSSVKMGTWCPYCAGKKVNEGWFKHYQDVAIKKGGKCLSQESEYVDARTNLKWKCSDGHVWEATPGSIKGRTWCPACGIKKRSISQRDSIENMKGLAKERGGKCLSKIYTSTHIKLKWICKKKHTWESTPASVKHGTWCPYCAGNRKVS
jgi:hypothetical protein